MLYKDYINELKSRFVGKRVSYKGKLYDVVDVDYNGGVLINKKARFTDTTAVSQSNIKIKK